MPTDDAATLALLNKRLESYEPPCMSLREMSGNLLLLIDLSAAIAIAERALAERDAAHAALHAIRIGYSTARSRDIADKVLDTTIARTQDE